MKGTNGSGCFVRWRRLRRLGCRARRQFADQSAGFYIGAGVGECTVRSDDRLRHARLFQR